MKELADTQYLLHRVPPPRFLAYVKLWGHIQSECQLQFQIFYDIFYLLIQYRGEAEVVLGNTVVCSLELPGLCPGQYLPPGRTEVVLGNTVVCSLELPGLCPGQYLPPGRSR